MTQVVTERLFEEAITDHLVAHGGYHACKIGTSRARIPDFDAARGLDTVELLGFITATQPKLWANSSRPTVATPIPPRQSSSGTSPPSSRAQFNGQHFIVEDWADRVFGMTWQEAANYGAPAATDYAKARIANLPNDDAVVLGKIGDLSVLVHQLELEMDIKLGQIPENSQRKDDKTIS